MNVSNTMLRRPSTSRLGETSGSAIKAIARLTLLTMAVGVSGAYADEQAPVATERPRICSRTAHVAHTACAFEVADDFYLARANCLNVSSPAAARECNEDALAASAAASQECRAYRVGRLDLCDDLGEAAYDPPINPSMFVDPAQIGTSVAPNPYFLLIPGRAMVYRDGTETITVEVTGQTREILGVTCAEVHDVVIDDGVLIEDTIDWYAQDLAGNVWYFGEIAQNFEDGVLVNIDGSWTAGVDSAKPGIAMKVQPRVDDVYRQEFALGNAEDAAEVLSLTASASSPAASCANNCLQTEDSSPIIPDLLEHKFYKPGVGFILEIDPVTGARLELVEIRN